MGVGHAREGPLVQELQKISGERNVAALKHR